MTNKVHIVMKKDVHGPVVVEGLYNSHKEAFEAITSVEEYLYEIIITPRGMVYQLGDEGNKVDYWIESREVQ